MTSKLLSLWQDKFTLKKMQITQQALHLVDFILSLKVMNLLYELFHSGTNPFDYYKVLKSATRK